MSLFKRFFLFVFKFICLVFSTFNLLADASCKDICNALDRYTLVCTTVVQKDLHDCHKKYPEISIMRLDWFSLNHTLVDRRDFYVFQNLSEILVEPSNVTGFFTRRIPTEEYENPELWTSYEAVGVFGRVLNVRLFVAFKKESCCSKWMSRMVLGSLLSAADINPWFHHCLPSFNLFCDVNFTKPPRWMVMAWLESTDELKDVMNQYCRYKDKRKTRFRRHILKRQVSQQAQETTVSDKKSDEDNSMNTVYTYGNHEKEVHGNKTSASYERESKRTTELISLDPVFAKIAFFRIIVFFAVVSSILGLCLALICCLYCKILIAARNISGSNNLFNGVQQNNANVSSSRPEFDQIPMSTTHGVFGNVGSGKNQVNNLPHNPITTAISNNVPGSNLKAKDVDKDKDRAMASENKKFFKRLRGVFGLQANFSENQSKNREEKELLLPQSVDSNDQNNNNVTRITNINSSNSMDARNGEHVVEHKSLSSSEEEGSPLSDEEELEEIFLEHLYNRMKSKTRHNYLDRFNKYSRFSKH